MDYNSSRMDEYIQHILPGLEEHLPQTIGQQLMEAISWSAQSPSTPDQAPAVVTGNLSESIELAITNQGVEVGTHLPYGAFLEFGTSHVAPRPWLRPAVERVRSQIADLVRGMWAV